MWIFTSAGFVSAVEHREDENYLMVRARDKRSLEEMIDGIELAGNAEGVDYGIENMEIYSVAYSDYPWRVVISKATFAVWSVYEIMNFINYHNFKDAAKMNRGKEWANALMGVWSSMLAVEDVKRERGSGWMEGYHSFKTMTDEEIEELIAEARALDGNADEDGYSDLGEQIIEMNKEGEVESVEGKELTTWQPSRASEDTDWGVDNWIKGEQK